MHIKYAACYSETPTVGENLDSVSEVCKSQRIVFHTFSSAQYVTHTINAKRKSWFLNIH